MPTIKAPRAFASAAVVLALAATATACGGGSSTNGSGGDSSPKTLTYWASNQGSSIAVDQQVLGKELKKFQQQTGIKVKLEVIGWPDLLNRILAATTSGQGPDVLNIGNTWSASLQATGAFLPFDSTSMAAIGGNRFTSSAVAAAGAAGKPPAAVPLYSLSYGLYWNKAEFKKAGISAPPTTWSQLIADGKKLTTGGQYGLAMEGASYTENAHHAFIFGKQHGVNFFTADGKPQFNTPGAVAAVKQYIDLMATDKIASPSDAEYDQNQSVTDFASGKAAMLLWQAAGSSLKAHGMDPSKYGVAPIPFQTANPTASTKIDSMVAGINMAVFKNTKNRTGALKFVKFMTSTAEQKILNKAYGSIPPVVAAQNDPAFSTPELQTLRSVLGGSSAPMPQVADESQFETLVGTAMKSLFADAAAGKPVTTASVKAALTKAQQQMPAS